VHVLAPTDLRPDVVGDVDLVDSETGRRLAASLAPAVLDRFERVASAWREEVAGRCRAAGAAHVSYLVGDDLETVLLGAARTSGVLR
jgi:hypothetical protein